MSGQTGTIIIGDALKTLRELEEAVRGRAPTLSERIPPDATIKPYVDVDRKDVPAEEFAEIDEQARADVGDAEVGTPRAHSTLLQDLMPSRGGKMGDTRM